MTIYAADIESDGLLDEITKVWCASFAELDSQDRVERSFTLTDKEGIGAIFADPSNTLIMHNGYGFDKPAIEKVYGIKVEATIVDTLYLSWYLYPLNIRHGLAWWGEELGIAKPEVEDWSDQPIEVYIHRCEEDVRIQTALWRQINKHLKLLYGTHEASAVAVTHLNFKAKCAAMQEKSRWKLDVVSCEKYVEDFTSKYQTARVALEKGMPDVAKTAKKSKPKKPFKANGELSTHGLKWVDIVREHVPDFAGRPENYGGELTVIIGYKPPNAGSAVQIKAWLDDLGWVPETFKHVRDKETNEQRKIPQIKNTDTGELCPSVERLIAVEPALDFLREMSVVKHRLGVCEGFLKNVTTDGYLRAGVQGFTNTLRFKHRTCVNLPSTRKPYGSEIRGLLTARSSDMELCGSDMSSLEDRTKQHYMWSHDPEYVKEMQAVDFDPHLDMAVTASMMTKEDTNEYKELKANGDKTPEDYDRFAFLDSIRHGGKTTNYAATYGAKGPTIARAAGVPEATGDRLYNAYWRRNWSLTAIADECQVKQSRGLKWLWNPVAKMWFYLKAEKDRFSTLNQSTGAFCFDRWLYHVIERRPQLTAQFHDEGVWELKKGNRDQMESLLKAAIGDVNVELKLNRDLDVDVDFADNYAGVH